MTYDLLIQNVHAYAPEDLGVIDIAVKNGKIAAMGKSLSAEASRVIDAEGLLAIPGVIETHAHMLLPFSGTQTMNDFYDGTRAGLYGGVTTLIDFADQTKGGSIDAALSRRLELAKKQCAVDYSFHCTLTDINDETLEAIPRLVREGFTSFKFYTAYKSGGLLVPYEDMERAFAVIAREGALATVHAEDEPMILEATAALQAQGKTGCKYFLQSKPDRSEPAAIEKLIDLVRKTGARLLIRHVSSAEGAQLIAAAQAEGLPVYGETCPHYLYFDESVYERENASDYIVNPPIRTAKDREGIWKVLSEGSFFTIGTDDCGFYLDQKRVSENFWEIPGGMPGLETRLAVLCELASRNGLLSMERIACLTSKNPAILYGAYPQKGCLQPGSDADIVLLRPGQKQVLTASMLHEKTDYTPFEGLELHMTVEKTIACGKVLMENGNDISVPGAGKRLYRKLPGDVK